MRSRVENTWEPAALFVKSWYLVNDVLMPLVANWASENQLQTFGLPELGELDSDSVDLVGIIEDRVRAGSQRARAANQRARGQSHRVRHKATLAAAITNFPLQSINSCVLL